MIESSMQFTNFFKDHKGKIVIYQHPNVLLTAWVLLSLANVWLSDKGIALLTTAALFAWAYDELTRGVNRFRKTLGSVILLFIIINALV